MNFSYQKASIKLVEEWYLRIYINLEILRIFLIFGSNLCEIQIQNHVNKHIRNFNKKIIFEFRR